MTTKDLDSVMMNDLDEISNIEDQKTKRRRLGDYIFNRSSADGYGDNALRLTRSLMLHPFYSSNYDALITLMKSEKAFQREVDEILGIFSPCDATSPPRRRH